MKVFAILTATLFLAACAQTMGEGSMGPRQVGTILDPLCASDGSVVTAQFPNEQGTFGEIMASRENCPWNQ